MPQERLQLFGVRFPKVDQLGEHLQGLRTQMVLDVFHFLFDRFCPEPKQSQKLGQRLVPRLDPGGHGAAFHREGEPSILFVVQQTPGRQAPHHVGDGGRRQAQFLGHVYHAGVTLLIHQLGDPFQVIFRGVRVPGAPRRDTLSLPIHAFSYAVRGLSSNFFWPKTEFYKSDIVLCLKHLFDLMTTDSTMPRMNSCRLDKAGDRPDLPFVRDRRRGRSLWGVCFILWSLSGPVLAAETGEKEASPAPDKTRYHLFNPTPREQMREMSTDRPDKTESAYSLDAGHFQLEMDLVAYARDHDVSGANDVKTEAYSIAPVNLKVGLLNDVDFQLLLQSYVRVRVKDRNAGTVSERSGFGDIATRLKVNLWGNDGGRTALALMPFAKFPSNQDHLGNDSIEGGVIVPLAVELPWGWGMGVMTQFNVDRDVDDSGYHPAFINSITFSHDIYGGLAGFVEFFSEVSTEQDSDWIGTLDLGLTYRATENLQLDGGVYIGATESADDVAPFLGLSWRY